MAINPENVDTVTVTELDTAALALTNFFAHSAPSGQLKKATFQSLVDFTAPYVSALGASEYVNITGTALPDPVTDNNWSIVGAGTYTQTGESDLVLTGDLNIIFWNGTTWTIAKEITIDLSDYAKTVDVIDISNHSSTDKERFNYLLEGNKSLVFFDIKPPTTVYSFQKPTGVYPFPLVDKIINIASTGAANSFVGKAISADLTDRTIAGAWFNKTVLDIAGVTRFGFYTQTLNSVGSVVETADLEVAAVEIVKGAEYVFGDFKLTVVEIHGDWVFLTIENTADFSATVKEVAYNIFVTSAATVAPFSFYVANVVMLKGEQEINPYLIYGNNYFYGDTEYKRDAKQINTANHFNYLQRGNENEYSFWSKTPSSNIKLDIYGPIYEPEIMNNIDGALYISVTGVTIGQNAYISRDIPTLETDRHIFGLWTRLSEMNSTMTGFGFIIQGFTSSFVNTESTTITIPIANIGTEGYTKTVFGFTARVEVVQNGWAYISCKHNVDFTAGTTICSVNIVLENLTTGSAGAFIGSITALKSDYINPYVSYSNFGHPPLKGYIAAVTGDSIVANRAILNAIERLTGMMVSNLAAIAGSGYTNTTGLTLPPVGDSTRLDQLTLLRGTDIFILEPGINDWSAGADLGTFAGRKTVDNSKFYNSVYKCLKDLVLLKPKSQILVFTPMPNYNSGKNPDIPINNIVTSVPQYQYQFADAIIEVCADLKIPCFDAFRNIGINEWNQAERLEDGLHPQITINPEPGEENGDMIAKTWIKQINLWLR